MTGGREGGGQGRKEGRRDHRGRVALEEVAERSAPGSRIAPCQKLPPRRNKSDIAQRFYGIHPKRGRESCRCAPEAAAHNAQPPYPPSAETFQGGSLSSFTYFDKTDSATYLTYRAAQEAGTVHAGTNQALSSVSMGFTRNVSFRGFPISGRESCRAEPEAAV